MMCQMEMKLDASQETIVDQQQTIEKFRELVRGMQAEMGELRAKGERKVTEDTAPQAQAMMSLQTQLKSSAMKQTSRVRSGETVEGRGTLQGRGLYYIAYYVG